MAAMGGRSTSCVTEARCLKNSAIALHARRNGTACGTCTGLYFSRFVHILQAASLALIATHAARQAERRLAEKRSGNRRYDSRRDPFAAWGDDQTREAQPSAGVGYVFKVA